MILNLIATVILGWFIYHNVIGSMRVWAGPYEEKGKIILMSAGYVIGALATLLAVWL